MFIGRLRHYVELQSASESINAYGERTESFAKYANAWARIEPLNGRELEHARQINGEISHRVTIRYNSNVAVKHRVVYDSRNFEINAVINPDERNRYLQLMCTEVV